MLSQTEDQMQVALIQWASHHPICKDHLIHIPNESPRTIGYGRKLKSMGMRKGVSDLFLAYSTKRYSGLWIELKSAKGKLSKPQKDWLNRMKLAGYCVGVIVGDWILAKELIEAYLLDNEYFKGGSFNGGYGG